MIIAKTAYEVFYRYRDFTLWLASGETLSTATVTITDAVTGIDMSSTMVANVTVYQTTQVKYQLKGGVAGSSYNISIKVVTSNAQDFEDKTLLLNVI